MYILKHKRFEVCNNIITYLRTRFLNSVKQKKPLIVFFIIVVELAVKTGNSEILRKYGFDLILAMNIRHTH